MRQRVFHNWRFQPSSRCPSRARPYFSSTDTRLSSLPYTLVALLLNHFFYSLKLASSPKTSRYFSLGLKLDNGLSRQSDRHIPVTDF
jgi:hypothetical protein